MKQKHLLICLVTALLIAPFAGASARPLTINVKIIEVFDYPGAVWTLPRGVNNNNEIAGSFSDGTGTFGFTRSADGQYSEPLMDPDDTQMYTSAYGVNDSGTVCGSFAGTDGTHGFFLSDGTYTTYDVPGESGTQVTGINNVGDFVGNYYLYQAFISVGGTVTPIDIPGGSDITANGLNSLDQVVGSYAVFASRPDVAGGFGFYSDPSGQLHYPISPPHGYNTYLYGINDQGIMVGGYVTYSGHFRVAKGLVFIAPNHFLTVDYGSYFVYLTGINNNGLICGYYTDGFGQLPHGLIAQVVQTAE